METIFAIAGITAVILAVAFGVRHLARKISRSRKITPALVEYQKKLSAIHGKERVIGLPAYGLVAKYGKQGSYGERSEVKTALTLAKIPSFYQGAYVLNNVQFTPRWDIDHVVIAGDTMILIDTKNWQKQNQYTLARDERGEPIALKNTQMFPGNKINMEYYLKTVRRMFPKFNVYGVMNIDAYQASMGGDEGFIFSFVRNDKLLPLVKNILSADRAATTPAPARTRKTVSKLAANTHS